ncbi:hypothetical protein LSCM1_06283 [Leishmania martiniquensis]|uniref:CBF1-interacting co-repressor CIR N-terminal domain-containing protein n=1 Tax=Leishmania martiniquensis TaxID=1580590 RepID=A0A836GWT4_9TRYP|nr:hypothetical protein LSCM1_06283 [Leishmania martiniquensis]
MYRAHSKDINRNKSFHPLTYRNLRRVEQLKEDAELNKAKAAERQKQLQHDQEERRYDELVLANSADSLSGELARYRQTRSIFAAEYEADAKSAKDAPVTASQSPQASKQEVQLKSVTGSSLPANGFLSKFKREEAGGSAYSAEKVQRQDDTATAAAARAVEPADAETPMRKRPRDDENGRSVTSSTDNGSANVNTTGFVTSAEAAQLRKELNLAQKQRHDPLMRVKEYQNRCVAAAARQQQREQESRTDAKQGSDDKNVLQSRIRELLALRKKR